MSVVSAADAKIVMVVGHGLAGKMTVEELSKKKGIRVIVIESRAFCEVDTLSPIFVAEEKYYGKFSAPQSLSMRPGVTYVHGTVAALEPDGSKAHCYKVHLQNGEMLAADAVVCCVGSQIPLLKPEVGATQEARSAELDAARLAISTAKSVLVVGGGSVGVELAGMAVGLATPGCKIKIAVSGPTVLNDGFSMAARTRLAKHMMSEGVEILPNTKIVAPPGQPLKYCASAGAKYDVQGGGTLEADVLLPSFSTFALPFLKESSLVDARGRLLVDEHLRSPQLRSLFGVACISVDSVLNIPVIQGMAKVAAHNAHCVATGTGSLLPYVPSKDVTGDPWVHYQLGGYSLLNLPGPLGALSWCCGFPLPCFCCVPGCCMPCGYSCCPADGKGASQFFRFMLLSGPGTPHVAFLKKPGDAAAAPTPAAMVH